jgi:4-hydroxy-3-methylbut-2-enyl diphosphate reductase
MCFGVRDAIDLALQLTRQGPITILGDLVHNPDVLARMEDAGARQARDASQVQTRALLLTAHGTAGSVKAQLRADGHQVHDATCPLVKRVHTALTRLLHEGRYPVIVGQAGHVEVRGLVGDLTEYTVILSVEDVDKLAGPVARNPRLGVVAQTTQPHPLVEQLVGEIYSRFPQADVKCIDTVCQPTKDRQDSLRQLVSETEAVVVIGGVDSNNSRKLTELALSLGRPAYQVARASELRPEWFRGLRIVGLTAGTSTPQSTIEEVRAWLEDLPDEEAAMPSDRAYGAA